MGNFHKYGLGFQVEAKANFMNLIFVLQGHELTVKPRAKFKATLILHMNLGENYARQGSLCWIKLCLQNVIKSTAYFGTHFNGCALMRTKSNKNVCPNLLWGEAVRFHTVFIANSKHFSVRVDHKVAIFQNWFTLRRNLTLEQKAKYLCLKPAQRINCFIYTVYITQTYICTCICLCVYDRDIYSVCVYVCV